MPNPGVYNDAKVMQSQMGRTQGGKEQLAIQWSLESGESVWSYHYFSSEKALEWTAKTLANLGWDPTKNDWRLNDINGTDLLVGRTAQLVLEEEEYNGERRVKVRYVNPPGGGGIRDAMTAAEVDELAARLSKTEKMRADEAPEEDIPF